MWGLHLDLISHQATTTVTTKKKVNLVLHWPVHPLPHRHREWAEEGREGVAGFPTALWAGAREATNYTGFWVCLTLTGPMQHFLRSSSSIQLKLFQDKAENVCERSPTSPFEADKMAAGCSWSAISRTLYSGWGVLQGKWPRCFIFMA